MLRISKFPVKGEMTLSLRCGRLRRFQQHQLCIMLLQTKNLHRARAPCAAFTSITLRLMLVSVCWIPPIQAVSRNYMVKQGLCTRGNKVCLWEGPQTSHSLYNRNRWRPFSSCWHAYRCTHTHHMPPVGIPKAQSDIPCFCSYTRYFMRHRSPGDTELRPSAQLHSCFAAVSFPTCKQNNRKVRQALPNHYCGVYIWHYFTSAVLLFTTWSQPTRSKEGKFFNVLCFLKQSSTLQLCKSLPRRRSVGLPAFAFHSKKCEVS